MAAILSQMITDRNLSDPITDSETHCQKNSFPLQTDLSELWQRICHYRYRFSFGDQVTSDMAFSPKKLQGVNSSYEPFVQFPELSGHDCSNEGLASLIDLLMGFLEEPFSAMAGCPKTAH